MTLTYLHLDHRDRAGRLERASFRSGRHRDGSAAGIVGVLLDIDAIKVLGCPLGAGLWLAAVVPFGVATVRAGVVPAHVGAALAVLEP